MKVQSGKKTMAFVKPKIRKGYYFGQLKEVKPYLDKDGNEIVSDKGAVQVIFDFQVFKADPESGEIIGPVTFKPTEDSEEKEVMLSKFFNYKWIDRDKNTGGEIERSGITPKSNITKCLCHMGWEFEEEVELDFEDFIGKGVELNINDYTKKDKVTGEETTFSIIEGLGKWEFTNEAPKVEESKPEPKEEVKAEEPKEETKEQAKSQEESDELAKVKAEIAKADDLLAKELVTKDGYDKMMVALNAKLKELQ